MTRARALKTLIRARAAKTGERYTTARRHVLAQRQPVAAAKPAAVQRAEAPKSTKGGLSDAATRKKTGHGLDHWFAVLDRFGGVEKGHTASARHLAVDHGVPGWHAQGITVAYERARGVRAANQRCDGEYEVSVSKTIAAKTADAIDALANPRAALHWARGLDASLVRALTAGLTGAGAKGIVVRADGQARFRYKWAATQIEGYLYPKPGGKVSVVVTNSKLATAAMVEERRALWRATLTALAAATEN
jgi:hypothetical protein